MNKKLLVLFLSLLLFFRFSDMTAVVAVVPHLTECREILEEACGCFKKKSQTMARLSTWMRVACSEAIYLLEEESSLLKINSAGGKVIIVGDVHSNLGSVLYSCRRFLDEYEQDVRTTILFLGDYVDRGERAPGGPKSIEIILLLFFLKHELPDNVFLLRGNHEDRSMNRKGDNCLLNQCFKKWIGDSALVETNFERINNAFDYLSLAAVIDGHVFCVHGGICSMLELDAISRIKKPIKLAGYDGDSLVKCLLWSDPKENVSLYKDSERGEGKCYGEQAVRDFCEINRLDCIVRAHESVSTGHDIKWDTVHTVFSAFNYYPKGYYPNIAKILVYDGTTRQFTDEKIIDFIELSSYVVTPLYVIHDNPIDCMSAKEITDADGIAYGENADQLGSGVESSIAIEGGAAKLKTSKKVSDTQLMAFPYEDDSDDDCSDRTPMALVDGESSDDEDSDDDCSDRTPMALVDGESSDDDCSDRTPMALVDGESSDDEDSDDDCSDRTPMALVDGESSDDEDSDDDCSDRTPMISDRL